MRTTIIALFLLLMTQESAAIKTINKITTDDFNGSPGQVILNGKLFFVDNDGYMWISEGTSENAKPLLYNNQKIKSFWQNALLKFNDSIVFINLSDGLTLWKTDGTVFEKLSDLPFNYLSGIYLNGDNVVGITDIDSTIVIYDGLNVFNADVSGLTEPRISSVCPLNGGDFTILARAEDLNYGKLFSYKNGMFAQIASDIINETNVLGLPTFALKHNDACYYQYEENTDGFNPKYLQVTEDASVSVIESSEGISTWKKIFVFDENLYFIRSENIFTEGTNEFDGKQIFQLNNNSSTPVKFESLDFSGPIVSVKSSANYLYLTVNFISPSGIVVSPPPPPIQKIFDLSFNEVMSESTYNLLSVVSSTASGDVLLSDQYEISFIDQGVKIEGLQLASAFIYNVISDNLMTYAIGKDRNNGGKTAIYIISDQALISDQLTGLWISPDWQSQGLSLHTGKRTNGSVYIFASLYLYRDGQPLWLAGNADFVLGSSEITFDLFEFKGSSFLPNDGNTPFETISFGQITLSPSTCDSLDMLLDINNSENVNLNLNRIVNTNNANVCIP